LSRAAKAGALNVGLEDRLGKGLNTYAEALEKVGLYTRQSPFGTLNNRFTLRFRLEMLEFSKIKSSLTNSSTLGKPRCPLLLLWP
jgi:hypothetical protein